MADMFAGVAAPDVQYTKSSATSAPGYYTDYLTNLAQTGQTQLAKTPDQLVAPLTAMQQAGYSAVPAAAAAYQPGLSAAEKTAADAGQVTTSDIQGFINPYTTNVVNEMERLQQQNLQRNLLPALKSAFVGTGGLGGQRYAGATGQTLADLQANLTGQQTTALQKGYSDALQAALQQAQTQNQVAQTQGALAGKEQEYGLTGAGALTKAGGEQQAYEQSLRDAALKNATNVAALLRQYNIPTTVSESYKGPMAGVYSNSPLSQVAGLGTLLASAFNTTTSPSGATTTPFGLQAINYLKGLFPSSSTNPSGVTPDEQAVIDSINREKAAQAAADLGNQ